jgi:hypothetical protein
MNNPTHFKRQIASLILIFSAAVLARPCAATPGEWEVTGSLGTARASHTATLLPSGKVLVAGGDGNGASTSAELYDPATVSITKAKVRTLTFNGNSADLGGTAKLGDGTKVTYSVTVADSSSDGSTDTFNITLSNGYSAGGVVTNGDISIE